MSIIQLTHNLSSLTTNSSHLPFLEHTHCLSGLVLEKTETQELLPALVLKKH